MPHMANLPWLQMYLMIILLLMMIMPSLNWSKHDISINNTEKNNSKKQKWSW